MFGHALACRLEEIGKREFMGVLCVVKLVEKTYSRWVKFEMRWRSGGVGSLVEDSAYIHRKTFQSCCVFAAVCSYLFGYLMVSSPPFLAVGPPIVGCNFNAFAANNEST